MEIRTHLLRVMDGSQTTIWRVMTGGDETILLDRKEISAFNFSVLTPYIQTHRFYGRSVADLMIDVQKIKTSLMRMLLDSGYFALNQRMSVDLTKATEWTLSDLMRNEPLMPIRVKEQGAVAPVSAGGLSFDVPAALEYFSTVGEQRTGIVRNAQGLNPDTLHDTATGAVTLMSAAQKRLRLIARVFAEMGLKDLFVGIHATLRENATKAETVKLRGQWVSVDPTKWGARTAMTCEVGLGSAGREHDIMALQQAIPLIERVAQQQSALGATLVTPQNVYALVTRALEKLGFKSAGQYITDPSAPLPPGAQPPQPQPNGDLVKAQGELQIKQTESQATIQTAQAKAQADVETDRMRAQLEAQTAQMKAANELQLAREKLAADTAIAQQQAANDLQVQRERIQGELALKERQAQAELAMRAKELQVEAALKAAEIAQREDPSPSLPDVGVGGEPG